MDIKLKSSDAGNPATGGGDYAGTGNGGGEDVMKGEGGREEDRRPGAGIKTGLLAAALLTVLSALIFLAMYPVFRRNAQVFRQDGLQDENFLTRLNVSNYVFYKDIVEKVEQNAYSYSDLYVDMAVTGEYGSAGEYVEGRDWGTEASENYVNEDIDSFMGNIREQINSNLHESQGNVLAETAQLMDYCVIDNKTGELIKNTERGIEAIAGWGDTWGDGGNAGIGNSGETGVLAGDRNSGETGIYAGSGNRGEAGISAGIGNSGETGISAGTGNRGEAGISSGSGAGGRTAAEQVKEGYAYYVMLSFDSVGNLDKVSVKDENSDELLKKVQNVMKNKLTEQWVKNNSSCYYGLEGTVSGYSSADSCVKTVHYRLGTPHDVTFIYAMTEGQKQTMMESGFFNSGWNEWYVYYQSGVQEVFSLMLTAMALVLFVLMRFRWYGLHRPKAAAVPLEIGIMAVPVWFAGFGEWLVWLVEQACTGKMAEMYAGNLSFVPADYYKMLTFLINFVILVLLFGGWAYIVNSFGGVWVLGVKGYLQERSIAVKLAGRVWGQIRKRYDQFKHEVLHVDLGKAANNTVRKVVLVNFLLVGVMCSMWVFGWTALVLYSFVLYFVLKKYVNLIQMQYRKMLEATNSIAEGNLHTVFDEDLGIFESYKEELYRIQEGFRRAVDEEVKSQRLKTELITNVSHDLKTPLTAITTYIDLLKEENITKGQREEYLKVLEKKSLRLKTLIEDLFEVSKANSRNVTVNLVDVDICNLMRQVYLEYEDQVEEANLVFRFRMPQEKVVLKLDSQKTYRIFENLYTNIIKYAMTGTRVYVDLAQGEKGVRIELKNMSAMELHVEPAELTERFVRGDSSRNTEGSGLGLAIAKSFVEIQGGKMDVMVDGDLFKVILYLA